MARIFHEMDLPDLQGADGAAVVIYRKTFRNATDQVKASRPKGDNLRQQAHGKKGMPFFISNESKSFGANCHERFGDY